MTIYEKTVKELGASSLVFTFAINALKQKPHDKLSDEENVYAETIIKWKEVNPLELAEYYWKDESSPKTYNRRLAAVWRCLSKQQWDLLKRYYCQLVPEENA